MNSYKKPFVIAEIGCNHKGEMEIAKELIKIAKIFCNVDAVKFQKRNNIELLTEEQYNAAHPNPANSYGETYGAHREYLEFNLEENAELKKYCDEIGIVYSTSVWDTTSAKEIASLNPEFIKIPSACNNNYEMLGWLCDNYKGEIHISTGMTTKNETDDLVQFFVSKGRNKDNALGSVATLARKSQPGRHPGSVSAQRAARGRSDSLHWGGGVSGCSCAPTANRSRSPASSNRFEAHPPAASVLPAAGRARESNETGRGGHRSGDHRAGPPLLVCWARGT